MQENVAATIAGKRIVGVGHREDNHCHQWLYRFF